MPMRYVVLVKGVPDFSEGTIQFKEDNTLDRGSTGTTLNPNDHMALEAALEAKVKHGGEVVAMCMGPPNYKVILQEAMERYADRLILLSDRYFAAADTLATAEALRLGIETVGDVDAVFAGFKSADGETGQTGPQTAWKLGWPIVTHLTGMELDPDTGTFAGERITQTDVEVVEGPLPAILVTDPAYTPYYPKASHRLKLKDLRAETLERAQDHEAHLEVWDHESIGADQADIGMAGSPTIVRAVDPIPQAPREREAELLQGDDVGDLEKLAQLILEKREVSPGA